MVYKNSETDESLIEPKDPKNKTKNLKFKGQSILQSKQYTLGHFDQFSGRFTEFNF